jgi:hypothetical protein
VVYNLAYDGAATCSDNYNVLDFPTACTLAVNSDDDGNDDEGVYHVSFLASQFGLGLPLCLTTSRFDLQPRLHPAAAHGVHHALPHPAGFPG